MALAVGCQEPYGLAPVTGPEAVTAQPISITTISVDWTGGTTGDAVAGYRLERRENLQGEFHRVAEGLLARPYFDTGLKPDTYYGYRVETLTKLGDVSSPSVVAGARTPPAPGILVRTHTLGSNIDTDGYSSSVRGASDSAWASMGPTDSRRFSPLPPARYAVELQGVAANCTLSGSAMDSVDVTDQGLNTLVTVEYDVTCRDPNRGEIAASVVATGDSLDSDGYVVHMTGLADSAALPDSLRIVSRQTRFPAGGGTYVFGDLRPGAYELTLEDVAAQCTVTSSTTRSVRVGRLDRVPVSFAVDCQRGNPSTGNRPYVLRNRWTPKPVAPGQHTTLAMTLDLTTTTGLSVAAAQGELRYNQAALRFDSAKAGALDQFTVNGQTPGLVVVAGLTTGVPPAGVVPLAQLYFTAVGPSGATSHTRTDNLLVLAGDQETQLDTLVRVVEDTVIIAAGGSNQAPHAEANGPYAGAVSTAIAFSAVGSSDPDGTVTGYAWTFGDGGSATGASPTHAYSAPGTYMATLVVTDNLGATATDQATVNVTGGGGNQPPVAHANGPYTRSAGTPITFSSAGSSDPDGSITSYAWIFGDGGTANTANPSHAYSGAGVYTAALTVTDNQGATATEQATVTITNTPFTWMGSFGPESADSIIALSITLDLSADLPETPGPEALARFAVDSLKWDPTVLRYYAFNWGSGGAGVVNPTDAVSQGRLVFASFTLPEATNHGVITLATVRFRVIGATGRTTTTRTTLGTLRGTVDTGNYEYLPHTAMQEAAFTAP